MKTRKWAKPKPGTGRIRVHRDAWRTTVCRLIRAEQAAEDADTAARAKGEIGFAEGRQAGREDVLRLIALWGSARPLEGCSGAQMAEALRGTLKPPIASYTDWEGNLRVKVQQTEEEWTPLLRRILGEERFKTPNENKA